MSRLLSMLSALLVLGIGFTTCALAEKRVALVIGNSAYKNVGPLSNPVNDATAISALLRTTGFTVVELRDAGIAEFRRAVSDFSETTSEADIAVFFFAGHGIEVDRTNYLIPTDARLVRDFDVADETVALDRILQALEAAKRLRLVILDACRDNPFVGAMRRSTRSVSRGLARVDPTTADTLVAFAAKEGTVADDGGKNSPFTAALLKHLTTPGLDIRIALGRVRDDVRATTQGKQEPFVYGSLGGQTVALVSAPVAPQPFATPPLEETAQAWTTTKDATSTAVLEAFIRRFDGTAYADLARARLEELKKSRVAVISPATPPPQTQAPTQPVVGVFPPGRGEQFIPGLVYRTGAYSPYGIPLANGIADYYKLINARDGGINGVRIAYEECETGFATDRGIECYERLKGKGASGAAFIIAPSTGIAFALSAKAPIDKIPGITMGAGRSEWRDGTVFHWNFPLLGTYWIAADIMLQHIAKLEGGFERLRNKKIALIYHDSPFGRDPIALLNVASRKHGFELLLLPVAHPGVEQKATWLQIRQSRPDYVLLMGWGIMTSTAIEEAATTGFPRQKIFGIWWSGAEQDVRPAESAADGYNAVTLHAVGHFKLHDDLRRYLYERNEGTSKWEDTGEVLYIRGLINAMLGVEAIRTAQRRFGNKPLTGAQVRWGVENLDLSADRIRRLGFEGVLNPVKLSCADHAGARTGRIQTWDGKSWKPSSEWYTADETVISTVLKEAVSKYVVDEKITPRCLTE